MLSHGAVRCRKKNWLSQETESSSSVIQNFDINQFRKKLSTAETGWFWYSFSGWIDWQFSDKRDPRLSASCFDWPPYFRRHSKYPETHRMRLTPGSTLPLSQPILPLLLGAGRESVGAHAHASIVSKSRPQCAIENARWLNWKCVALAELVLWNCPASTICRFSIEFGMLANNFSDVMLLEGGGLRINGPNRTSVCR